MKLNLEANNKQEEIVKEYLENNVSEILADKINNGVKIIKDNKTLINKKTLNGFMKYACDEAKKQAEKGSNCACVEDKVVFGWAIHYFEEDEIHEKLYNEDMTEYKVEVKSTPKTFTAPKVETKPKKESSQQTLFDFMNLDSNKDIDKVEEKIECNEIIEDENNLIIDKNTGEVIKMEEQNKKISTFDMETAKMLYSVLDGIVILK